ncbi:Hsp20/alpha crystallin family protein [Dokdonella ginsengisoli]|uniref:Hsp20/alpha crystallin family protein n=1 Tax=Dokdonella ginsengisoli TaxID=363846 RepID=A0ABV9QYE7_9GAMM
MSTSVPPNASGPRAASTPFAELEDFFRSIGFRPAWRASDAAPDIRLDVGEDEANYVIRAEIPGVEKHDIELSIDGRQVSIGAQVKRESRQEGEKELHVERRYGRARRVFVLPLDVDAERTEATYERGILTVTLPKSADGRSRRVAIS